MVANHGAQQRATFAYNAAADHYDAPALGFWDYFGRQTIKRLAPVAGSHLLDVCCGSGASAIPAAEAVGPRGKVIGVDLAEQLLQLARAKASRCGLTNVRFEIGDMLALKYPNESFDAVVCVFGIFFVPDIAQAVRELWRVVKRGGNLALTTWGPRLFEPANSGLWQAIEQVRPELYKAFNPWDRINDVESLNDVLKQAGIGSSDIEIENRLHTIASPDDWWTIVLGSGYRGTIEQLNDIERAEVKERNFVFVREHKILAVETNVIYSQARKPVT